MIIGVPKEVKDHESRVGVTTAGAKALVEAGHKVLVEHNAGALSAMPDDEYQAAGAEIVGSAHDVWRLSEMVVKVKEPVEKEYRHFREGLVLFTYLHLAPLTELTDALLGSKVTGIAYETVRDRFGALPLLTPMSEVAGRMSVQVGAAYLEKEHGDDQTQTSLRRPYPGGRSPCPGGTAVAARLEQETGRRGFVAEGCGPEPRATQMVRP